MIASPPSAAASGAFAPFRHRAFALLWTATLISNIGTWMHDVSAAWLMTSLSPSPLVVALVQASTTAAMAMFALPAGAIADLFDRRRVLVAVTFVKGLLALLLGVLTATSIVSATSLLIITFLLGAGSALIAPAWQAIVPSLVPRDALKTAVSLNSAGLNVARAVGPSIGGMLIVAGGVASAFFLNASSEVVILVALLLWHPAQTKPNRNPETFLPAIIAGLRYAAHADSLKVVIWRACGFFVFASAFWALLPLLVRVVLQADAGFYGLMVGAVGAGAVTGAFVLPWVDKRLGANGMLTLGTLGTAAVLLVLASVHTRSAGLGAAFCAGLMWIFVLSTLNVSAQAALPDWVRGRGLSIYGATFFGAMTLGALAWGALASGWGIAAALTCAGTAMLASWIALRRVRLVEETRDLTPAGHWPDPVVAAAVEDHRGPVMVLVEYRIDPSRAADFLATIRQFAGQRRRDGAYHWDIMEDAADPGMYTECFLLNSWAEHERQHARVTRHDADMQARVLAFHLDRAPPRVRHLISVWD